MSKVTPDKINDLLPQTQCQLCTYKGCLPYAEAIIHDNSQTHLCQPGGINVYKAIQSLLNKPTCEKAVAQINTYDPTPNVVSIDLDQCIGCTKCLPACPVDAIVGAPKAMHHVIEAACNGCNLCIPTCPVDCITVKPSKNLPPKLFLLSQFENKQLRSEAKKLQKKAKLDKAIHAMDTTSSNVLAAALERAKKKRVFHEQT